MMNGRSAKPCGLVAASASRASRTSRAARLASMAMVLAVTSAGPAAAIDPTERLTDPQLEARARGLSAELRCLVCQNQSIDDSDAPLAKDLRRLVRERLMTGETDAQVKRFIVERYGDFVLLKPPFGWHTLLLWFTPVLVLAAIAAGIARNMRRTAMVGGASTGATLSEDEERRLEAILAGSGRSSDRNDV